MNVTEFLINLPHYACRLAPGAPHTEVTDVAFDSRSVRPGSVFVAVPGEKADGHAFARDAVSRGAVAVVAQRPLDLPAHVSEVVVPDTRRALAALSDAFHGHPSRRLRTIGVTGTNGKTTTCRLIASILEAAGEPAGRLGTIVYETGARCLPASMTTPEAPHIQQFLAEMLSAGRRYGVMEVSSHSLVQRRVDGIRFAAAVFTQLTPEHLDFHKTFSAYREAKALLFSMLGPDAWAILNADDPSSHVFLRRTKARALWYGLARPAQVRADVVSADLKGVDFKLHTPAGEVRVRSSLVGRHNVANCLAAASVAHVLGLDLDAVRRGIAAVEVVDGRLHRVDCGQPFHVLVDYAHTHHALETVLNALRPHVKGRLLVVFGAGGDRDKTKRPKMGDVVSRLADLAWLTSDNPRSEDPLDIIAQVHRGASHPEKLRVQPDRALAIAEALRAARHDDAVLLAGKGHERVQIFRDRTVPFDDREVARRFLQQQKVAATA